MTWSFSPSCVQQTPKNTNSTRIDCLFTSTEFRNGHGTSLVTSTTIASNLIGMDAFVDKPNPPVAVRRELSGPAYEVRPVPGKGQGVVATRRIRAGEIIMVDVPAVLIQIAFLADTKPHHRRRLLKKAINQLPEETRNKVYQLHRGSAKYEIDAILGPNSNTVMLADSEVHVGVFPEVAVYRDDPWLRLKSIGLMHSDRGSITRVVRSEFQKNMPASHPALYHSKRSDSGQRVLQILRAKVDDGNQILISYVPLETPAEQRRRYLKDNWEFECTCSLCRGPVDDLEDSESWRRKTKSLKETIADAKSSGYYKDAIVMTEELLLFSEWDKVPPFMPDYHDTLAHLNYLDGNMANATRYARMAMDGWVKLGSVDDVDLENARVFLEHLARLNTAAT
ncbi:hypothetical protein VTJ83DRAFT_4116 [Remersonia thermophila]|uniref:SET domain-containing protein n=1 Tax=Remersonia thermophila TaxID=72144 RepID=A0ABR4D9X7_9PEZI